MPKLVHYIPTKIIWYVISYHAQTSENYISEWGFAKQGTDSNNENLYFHVLVRESIIREQLLFLCSFDTQGSVLLTWFNFNPSMDK